MRKPVSIVVLYNEGCPATQRTLELIRACISEMDIPADVRTVLVRNQEDAEAWKFLGSPTIQVNGVDVDPTARAARTFGFM